MDLNKATKEELIAKINELELEVESWRDQYYSADADADYERERASDLQSEIDSLQLEISSLNDTIAELHLTGNADGN